MFEISRYDYGNIRIALTSLKTGPGLKIVIIWLVFMSTSIITEADLQTVNTELNDLRLVICLKNI